MKHIIYLNRWNDLFHLLVAVTDDDTHRVVKSRFCKTLAEARTTVAMWQEDYGVADEDVRDNSGIDLDVLFAHIEIDLDDVEENRVAGAIIV